jgi:large subunit ribosomal protein L24
MNRLKRSDKVIVISGKDKGKIGEVVSVNHIKSTVLIKGVNVKKKCKKATSVETTGEIVEKEFPLHSSKILHYSEKLSCPSRIGIRVENEKKVRFLKKCGTLI